MDNNGKGIDGTVEEILALEKKIRATGCFSMIHNGEEPFLPFGRGKPQQSLHFCRMLEVYPDRRAKEMVERMNVLDLFDLPMVIMKFRYDRRIDKAEVTCKYGTFEEVRRVLLADEDTSIAQPMERPVVAKTCRGVPRRKRVHAVSGLTEASGAPRER
ncbi:hypothetical protein LCGC14_1302430 [marine sediment metagenome]|uniref:Uncharacterized protein n=1 Tax=marine sediment metagenome TaxID=412755 RepID=A0A0F9L9U6_9ZZZZ